MKMPRKKKRVEIPKEIAAKILFLSDRTCCVCRERSKPVQIHHLDDDPSNNNPNNLAALCFECHHETQLTGGFDRKLDADQIILFRQAWYSCVAQTRAVAEAKAEIEDEDRSKDLELTTSLAEIYRENKEFELLAVHYNAIGNAELRDKYVEIALKNPVSDSSVCFLRGLQDRPELIPPKILKREIGRHTKWKDYYGRARLLTKIGRYDEAAKDYVRGILKSLEEGNVFSAAYYLKEVFEESVVDELFMLALKKAQKEKDLWWQVRAMQELGWDDELKNLLLENKQYIKKLDHPDLELLLAEAVGDEKAAMNQKKKIARMERVVGDGVGYVE